MECEILARFHQRDTRTRKYVRFSLDGPSSIMFFAGQDAAETDNIQIYLHSRLDNFNGRFDSTGIDFSSSAR